VAPPVKHPERQILDRAVEQFWVHGYGGTSMRDLERVLDLTAPSIYHRYGSKDALFARAIDHYVETIVEPRVARYLGSSPDPIVDLYRFFRTAQSPRGCMLTTTAVELGPSSSQIRQQIERGLDVIRRGLTKEAERVRRLGAPIGSPSDVAHALLVDLQGLMVLSRLGIAPAQLRRRTQMAFATLFGELFHPPG
jgi:TetR/AcrR family transcriptional repressor of nem operon